MYIKQATEEGSSKIQNCGSRKNVEKRDIDLSGDPFVMVATNDDKYDNDMYKHDCFGTDSKQRLGCDISIK